MAKRFSVRLNNRSLYKYEQFGNLVACEALEKEMLEYANKCEHKDAKKIKNQKYWKDLYKRSKLAENKLNDTINNFYLTKNTYYDNAVADLSKLGKLRTFIKGWFLKLSHSKSNASSRKSAKEM